jgi:AcrR family transcriptional regulator
MATTYQAGEQTKQKILRESSRLFYKQGFSKTTYDDISRATALNRALIPYHFRNKQLLGQAAYQSLLENFISQLDSILDISQFSADFVSLLHLVACYRLLEDAPFVRFLYELQSDPDFSSFLMQQEGILLSGFRNESNRLSDTQWDIVVLSEIGMKKELICMVQQAHTQHTTPDIDAIAKLQLSMLLSCTGERPDEIQELYDSAREVIDLMQFHISDYLFVEISYR